MRGTRPQRTNDAMERSLRAPCSPRAPRPSSGRAPIAARRKIGAAASRLLAAAAVVAWLASCGAVRPPSQRPYPTLDQYSDGASTLVAAFSKALYSRDKATLERLWPSEATARLATLPSAPPFESPSSLKV